MFSNKMTTTKSTFELNERKEKGWFFISQEGSTIDSQLLTLLSSFPNTRLRLLQKGKRSSALLELPWKFRRLEIRTL